MVGEKSEEKAVAQGMGIGEAGIDWEKHERIFWSDENVILIKAWVSQMCDLSKFIASNT